MKNINKSVKKSKKTNIFHTFLLKIENLLNKYLFPDDIKCIFCESNIP